VLALGVVLTVALGVAVVTCSPRNETPALLVDESVASDFRLLAEETWTSFLVVFRARASCFGPVTLRATRSLDSRAIYDPDTATVTVRVPGTPAMLQGALVHEFAHHVEFQCPEHMEFRPVFLAAAGLPAGMEWRPGKGAATAPASVFGDIPSEQYAEAAVILVLGRRPVTTGVRVNDEAVRAVEAWATGK
jgi:hypothetical protein